MKPIVLFLLLLSAIPCHAQTPENLTDVPKVALPDEPGSWVVEIFTSGGLTGRSGRDFALSSSGKISCDSPKPDCPKSFLRETLQPLFKNVAIAGQFLPDPNVPTLCADCITKTMIIRRRDSAGLEQTFTVSWDVLTASAVPPDLMRLYEAVMGIRNPKIIVDNPGRVWRVSTIDDEARMARSCTCFLIPCWSDMDRLPTVSDSSSS